MNSKIGLIIKREYLTRVKKKSFLIMTILGPILLVGFIAGAAWLSIPKTGDKKIIVVDEQRILNPVLDLPGENVLEDGKPTNVSKAETNTYKLVQGGEEDARTAVVNDHYDYSLYIPSNLLKGNKVVMFYKEFPSSGDESHLRTLARTFSQKIKLEELKSAESIAITEDQYKRISGEVVFGKENVDPDAMDEETREKAGVGLAFAIIIYMFIFIYGVQVMKGVIEEKTNRVVEVIVSSVKPFQLMMGKIIGIMFVGLTQFIIWIVLSMTLITVVSAFIPDIQEYANPQAMQQVAGQAQLAQEGAEAFNPETNAILDLIFNKISWGLLLSMFVIYFVGGYLLYGSLMAAVGAAVDSETDTQQFLLPVTAPLIFAYIISFSIIEDPAGDLAFWFSEIPLTSPVVMLVRIPMGTVQIWELILSVLLLIGTFIGTTWVASKIYRTGILMYGKKASYKEIFKWLRYRN